jgi:hypothetical protein
MAVKLFNRIGLRRDFNLTDLLSPETALGNILATDSMSGGEVFSVRDLDPIKDIYITDITADTFNTLDGIAVEFTKTTIDPSTGLPLIDEDTNPDIYLPLIKIKNRLDTAYFTTGEPFFFGGDGPNAIYYDSENIIITPDLLVLNRVYEYGDVIRTSQNRVYRAVVTDATTANNLTHTSGVVNGFQYLQDYAFSNGDLILNGVFDSVTGEELTESDNFWERGQFVYGNKVRDTFLSLFGGVNWKGFFKPVTSGTTRFYLRTTGSTVFKFQDPNTPSSTGLSYGRIPSATITSLTTYRNSLAIGSAGRIWVDTLLTILQDTARTFIEVNLDTAINIATDDIAYIEAKKGPLVSKQYKMLTRYITGEPNNVTQFFIEVTKDFNLKNVDITTVPEVTSNTAFFGFFRFYAWERRSQKTYINSIHHKLTLNSAEFTISGNTITFADTALGRFYYNHIMLNDYIYDYRRRSADTDFGVRRFNVVGLDDSTRSITCNITTDYNGNDNTYTTVDGSGNNDQQARHTPFSFEGGTTGTAINTTYQTGQLDDAIDSSTQTSNLFFVGRYAEITPRTKFITIEQFLPAYEEYAFDWTYYTRDEDVPNTGQVQEKAWVLWMASETSGFNTLNYKYLYDINYKFFQIGDFKVFLDNSVPYGGTSRESGIEQRAFGGEQLLSPGDQYNLFYSTLPVQSTYVPPVKFNDTIFELTGTFSNNSRLVTLSTALNAEVGSYITLRDGRNLYEDYYFSTGTRVAEQLLSGGSVTDVVLSKSTLQAGSNINVLVYNHRGFVTPLLVPYKGDGDTDSTFLGFNNTLPTNTCIFPFGTYSVGGSVVTVTGASTPQTVNGVTFTPTVNGASVEGPGIGQVFKYRGDVSEVQLGMVFVSSQDPSDQTEYRRVLNLVPSGTTDKGEIWLNRPYTTINGDLLSGVYYDRGIDITKPLETYCNNTNCAQNSYSIVTVTDPNTSETSLVTNINTRYVALQVASTNNADLNALWTETLGSGWYRNTQTTGSSTAQWWVDDNQTALTPAPDFTSNANSTRRYKENIVYVRLNSNSGDTAVALEQLGFSNLKNEISASIPFGTIEGALKIYGDGILGTTTNGYKYYFIVKLFTEVNVTTDTETDSNGNVIDKVLNWTEVASSSLNIQRFLHPVVGNEGTTALRSSNITSYSDLNTKYNAFVSSNTNNTTYAQLGNTFTLTAAQAATIFHNPNSIPVDGNGPNRILSVGQYVKYITLNGTRKLLWTRTFDSASFVGFGSSSSTGAMPYTSVTGLSIVDPTGNARIPNLINLQETYRDIRITGNTPNYDYMQFRGNTYEMVRQNSEIENRLPFIRMIHPNSTRTGITQYLQNSTNQRSVYTFAKGSAILSGGAVTFSKELCCPPLDTSPPFDSSPLGLSTTVNEPDMTMGGKINVRSIRATHPVLNIKSLPSTVALDDLPVDKKLRVNFGGTFYDMLIGNSDPNNIF